MAHTRMETREQMAMGIKKQIRMDIRKQRQSTQTHILDSPRLLPKDQDPGCDFEGEMRRRT